ncbi:uncharacterized protein [Choristoneura fumiferana]|uniref:uncharacterized protein n=1 Tax=Choristoneura fumiferana TaxID=7141 RepID=UPI003D15ED77
MLGLERDLTPNSLPKMAGGSGAAERQPLDHIGSPARLGKMGRKNMGCSSFHLAQVLSGHGCFSKYLCKIARRETTPMCHHCGGAEDTAQHTLQMCPAFDGQRESLKAVIGNDLSLPAVVKSMTDSEVVDCHGLLLRGDGYERRGGA